MADGEAAATVTTVDPGHDVPSHRHDDKRFQSLEIPLGHVDTTIPSPRGVVTPPLYRENHGVDLEDYFVGPRDMAKHSKWPLFLQMHGSIMPKMIVPLVTMAAWSTCITLLHEKVHPIGVDSILLTVLGFVVSTGLSFRGSTAYERYAEGRRFFASIVTSSQALGRVFWIHTKDLPGVDGRKQLLHKISSMNLVVAFAISLKHSLRFEPYTAYQDINHLVGHLNTFARTATESSVVVGKKSLFKSVGEYLGLSFAASNPRKMLKRSDKPLGNLPLEILNHLAITIDTLVAKGQLPVPMQQTLAYNNLAALNDAMTGTQRVLTTPLPIAYGILFHQITWLYVILLPFQLVTKLEYITIPATVASAYIIIGLLMIGQEIENPFGQDVNDLPLDSYCEQIATDMDLIASYDNTNPDDFVMSDANMPLYPVSTASADVWMQRSETKLKEAIKTKPNVTFEWKRWRGGKPSDEESGKLE